MPVKIQKSSDNYQNVRIMLAVLRFKKMGKIMLVFSNCAKIMLAQSIKAKPDVNSRVMFKRPTQLKPQICHFILTS